MGPRFANRGYQQNMEKEYGSKKGASMGPRFANRGYLPHQAKALFAGLASMGPRFANRGYPLVGAPSGPASQRFNGSTVREPWLSAHSEYEAIGRYQASMGPRFANRGYHPGWWYSGTSTPPLQWVHGSRTVVIT